ncbi:PspA/IM30 family protein [Tepidibacter formicigenes]|jgi:phage shock protein A|uniref:Phage shock protein A (PspA) family protein n=1 Tax=Tepidibacter formicigenes DSM 15518 TaxID=1123349 RepID=A0A1M6M391_9FIRM|nr:PspA/IM30 family protein [Tepidibacter formicigenes]SHJ77934.1 phage shock protein A (PspA) family protein [Tepidibacter formicigenes DSM 15518]
MGIFKRISNIIRGKANSALDNIENPIELLDLKIREMEESLNKAKLSSAEVIGNCHTIKKQLEQVQKEVRDYDEKIKLALSKNNEELAKKALQRKLDLEKKYESLKKSYEESRAKADELKKKLISLEEEIIKTRQYRDEVAARLNSAEASKKVNEILSNIDAGHNSINIDDIERKIQSKEALAEGIAELKDNSMSLDKEFEKLESEIDLDAELQKYKNQS